MFHHILVPLDGSKRSEQALPIAVRIARATEGSLLLVRVVMPYSEPAWTTDTTSPLFFPIRATPLSPGVPYEDVSQENLSSTQQFYEDEEESRYYLKMFAQSSLLAGIEVKTEVIIGKAAEEILTVAQTRQTDLIVMCSHGQTGSKRWMMGSVAQKVACHSPVPVMILREGEAHISTGSQRIMVALDGSALSEAVLLPAAYLSAALSAPNKGALHLVRILPIPTVFEQGQSERLVRARTKGTEQAHAYLKHLEQRLHEGGLAPFNLTITSLVDYDQDVAQQLISIAENDPGDGQRIGCDMLALATHGRSGLARFVMGSVVERVLGATQLPLLIVRPQKLE